MWSVNCGGRSHSSARARQSDEDGSQRVSVKMLISSLNPSGCFCVLRLCAVCRVCSSCYARSAGQMLFLLRRRLFGFPLRGGEAAHQKALAVTLTGRPSAGTRSLVELSNCSRQWSGIFPNRLRHGAILCRAFAVGSTPTLCPCLPTKE